MNFVIHAVFFNIQGILSSVTVDNIILYRWKLYPISFHGLGNLLKFNLIRQLPNARANKMSIPIGLQNQLGRFRYSSKGKSQSNHLLFEYVGK
jgi:hypothetical protein